MTKEIYIIAKFKLVANTEEKRNEWKEMSDYINDDMTKNAQGLIFRDSVIDKDGNVKCILKWESKEKQEVFNENFIKVMKEKPEIMEKFGKIADLKTMSKSEFDLV